MSIQTLNTHYNIIDTLLHMDRYAGKERYKEACELWEQFIKNDDDGKVALYTTTYNSPIVSAFANYLFAHSNYYDQMPVAATFADCVVWAYNNGKYCWPK